MKSSRLVPTVLFTITAALVLLDADPTRAEVGRADRSRTFITPGPSADMGILDGGLRLGGELALTQYWGSGGAGAAFGFTGQRIYFEVQPVLAFNPGKHTILLGLNPGFVIDVAGTSPIYGGQLTLWANYAYSSSWNDIWAFPLAPFARVQVLPGAPLGLVGGLMLKLPLNAA